MPEAGSAGTLRTNESIKVKTPSPYQTTRQPLRVTPFFFLRGADKTLCSAATPHPKNIMKITGLLNGGYYNDD